jgi:AAA ATPase domain
MHRVTIGAELAWGILAISSNFVPIPTLVWLPGPDRRPPTARSLLQPFVEEVVKRTGDALAPEIVEVLSELTLDIEDTLTTHLSAIVPRYVPGAISASVTTTGWDPKAVVRTMFTSNADSTEVYVLRDLSDPEGWDPKDRGRPPGSDPESALGAGASRALALGVLELYGDPELWPPDKPVLLALEEPEAGLHPAAQRQVARSLRTLSRKSGLQAIIVTHSPTMIDAVPMAAIRLVRAELDPDLGATSRIYLPTDLAEIAEAVGARPSDVLLADHFVIVEGPSDVDVFKSWARKLSIEIESSRTVLVSADGWNKAEVVARLARLAYPGSRIDVIVDGGESTNKAEDTIRRRSGREVQVHRLSKPEIEAYLPLAAIERWLVAQGSARGLPGGLGITRPGPRGVSEALNRVSVRDLGRQYRKGSDTGAIASLAKEEEIPAEVSELLIRLLAPEDPEEAAASSPD